MGLSSTYVFLILLFEFICSFNISLNITRKTLEIVQSNTPRYGL